MLGGPGQLRHDAALHRNEEPIVACVLDQIGLEFTHNMNLADPDSICASIRCTKSGIIVNSVAYTTVDKAKSEPDLVMRVNAVAPGILAEDAKCAGALPVHYYTNYAYAGDRSGPTPRTTRYEFAQAIFRLMKEISGTADGWAEIHPINPDQYPLPARPTLNPVSDKSKIKRVFGLEMPPWEGQLRRFLEDLASDARRQQQLGLQA